MPGCKAAAGIHVLEISEEPVLSINIDKGFIKRMVLSLSLDCHASMEGIRRTFASAFGLHISYGKISSILAEASERAEQSDAGIPLDNITQGANDEIFQGDVPVLTGIDAESTYVYLLAEADDRSADTWQLFMEDCKERGLAEWVLYPRKAPADAVLPATHGGRF